MINLEKLFAVLLAAGVVLFPLPGNAPAGCRAVVHHGHQKQAAVVFQPVYQQPYWYSVGQNYQIAAIVQETLKAQQLMQNQQQLNYAAPANPCPDGTCPPQPQTLPLTAPEPDRWALVKANCAGCHSVNQKAMEHVDMTDLSLLDCETKLKMAAAILDGTMPPKKSLDPNAIGQLLGEIVGAETVEK